MAVIRQTLADCGFDGGHVLELIIRGSEYGSLLQAVASLAVFSHPQTVAQTGARALFRIVRGPIPQRGQIVPHADGRPVLFDDNTGPTDAFLWANRIRRGTYADVQFCHIWQSSSDPGAYTNLANLCMLPAFLAKLSDTHSGITSLLRHRARQLYGWAPAGEPEIAAPDEWQGLDWAAVLPPNRDVAGTVRSEMLTKPKNRTTISARQIGWLFSDGPDTSLS